MVFQRTRPAPGGHPAPSGRKPTVQSGEVVVAKVHSDGCAGFTLVEVMIAVVMLSIGVLAVAQVFAVANQHTSFAREQSAATCLAEEIREKIMSAEYDDVYATFDNIDTNNPSSIPVEAGEWVDHLEAELGAFGRGQVNVDTEDTDATLAHGMLGVTITISWREGFGMTSLPLRFAIAKTGA